MSRWQTTESNDIKRIEDDRAECAVYLCTFLVVVGALALVSTGLIALIAV